MRSKILTSMMAVCFAVGVAQVLRAQNPENVRTELLNLADSVQEIATVGPSGVIDADSLANTRAQIQQMSAQDLLILGKAIDPSKFHGRLARARAAVAESSKAGSAPGDSPKAKSVAKSGGRVTLMDSTTFPVANGLCTSSDGADTHRIATSAVLAADVIYFVAEGVKEAAKDACNEVVVAVGEGGNGSLACEITDAIYVTAHAVNEGIHFCDDDLTGAVVDANYARLDDVHTDVDAVATQVTGVDTHLTNVDTHLSNVDTHISGEFTGLDTHVSNVDTHVATEISALDAHVTQLIAALAAQLAAAKNDLVDGEKQIMKLDLTPEGLRQLVPSILTCDGSTTGSLVCPNVLTKCPNGICSYNNVGPLP